MDNGESPFTLQMPTLARDNGCVCMCWCMCWCWWPPLIIVMSIFMSRWVAAGQRQWAVTAAAVSPLYTPSLAAPDWSYHCHVNIAPTQCHHTRMVILVTQRRLAGQCQTLNTAYSWSVSWGFMGTNLIAGQPNIWPPNFFMEIPQGPLDMSKNMF